MPFPFNPSGTMAEERPPTTDPYFATRNIMNNINNQENIILLPTQATQGGNDLLVCNRLLTIPFICEENEVVFGNVGWRWRMGQSTPYQTSDTTEPSSGAENEFGVMDTHGHTTLYYIPQLLPQPETTILNTPVAFTSNIACGCQIEDGEIMPNSWLPIVAAKNPPPTQEFVSGRIT